MIPLLTGATALTGWILGIPALMTVLPGLTTMKANAALGFLAAGASLLLIDDRPRPAVATARTVSAALLGALPLLLGVLTLVEYGTGLSTGIDQALFADPHTTSRPYPGRMAPATAIGLICTGAGILLLTRAARRLRRHAPAPSAAVLAAHSLAAVPGAIGYVALAGYAYDLHGLYNLGPFVSVALNTSVALTFTAPAMLLTLPDAGWRRPFADNPVTRLVLARLLPVALLMPFLSGAAVVGGARHHIYDPRYGPALFATVAAASSLCMAFLGAVAVRRAERQLAQTSDALRASEERLRIAQRAGRIGTFEWFPETGLVTVSEEYRRIFGLPMGEDVPAATLGSLVHPDDRVLTGMARMGVDSNPLRYAEYRVRRADTGEERWVARRGEPIVTRDGRGGETLRFVGVAFDVTDRKRADAALAESEARFRTLVEAMPQLAFMANPAGQVEFRSGRWADYSGMLEDETGRQRWLEALHPDDRAQTVGAWKRAVAGGVPYHIEHRLQDAQGQFRWFLTRAMPVRDEASGAITRWFGTSTDISEIVEARETLARSREELERIVAERTRDLAETQTRLAHAQRMEALGQLAGGIAHDFNNVMQAVLGAATLIQTRAADADRVHGLARLIQEAAGRGAAVTNRLLTFSRQSDLRAESVDAGDLLAGIQEILAHTLGDGVTVTMDMTRGLPNLLADKGQLEIVLLNLATNARDAMDGAGTLILRAALDIVSDGMAHRARLKPGRYVKLSVEDTGPGMAPEVLRRASEPFFTTKAPGKGTGLGLAMARGMAEQSGGGMDIASAPGNGTVVTLWLPVEKTDEAATPHAMPSPSGDPPCRARLLMVDDDPLVRETLAAQMEACGYAVLAVASGAAALAALDAGEKADLIVSDLSMPGMDGLTVIREAQRRRPLLPAILLTGFATNAAGMAMDGAMTGAFTLLRKPVAGVVLAERVAGMLDAAALAGAR